MDRTKASPADLNSRSVIFYSSPPLPFSSLLFTNLLSSSPHLFFFLLTHHFSSLRFLSSFVLLLLLLLLPALRFLSPLPLHRYAVLDPYGTSLSEVHNISPDCMLVEQASTATMPIHAVVA